MKVLKSANIFFKLAFVGYLLFSVAPTTQGFITSPHQWGSSSKAMHRELISKVHEPSWKIAYRYGAECKLEDRAEDKILEEAITAALNAWLQPLRDMKPARPITSVFHFQRQRDLNGDLWVDDRIEGLLTVDVRVTFRCENGFSSAVLSGPSPDIYIRSGAKLTLPMLSHLTHELGHAFGLWDTYIYAYPDVGRTTSGGLARTVGPQPSSVMAVYPSRYISTDGEILTGIDEDDKRGIIWLYKYLHEGLELEDCFFPDYVLEKTFFDSVNERDSVGCRPKYPLIFEIKHSHLRYVLELLKDDPTINVNAQDAAGMTALHHAAALVRAEVVQRLLEHKDIKPALKDKQGRTALDIAREAKATDVIALLRAVTPEQIVVDLNDDGIVNILDLVIVSSNFGEKGKNRADVNGDGTVDIRDLVLVAGTFGDNTDTAAAISPKNEHQ